MGFPKRIHHGIAATDLVHLQLGPRQVMGLSVVLRSPRFDDFEQWRAVRMRSQRFIEPFWVTSRSDWSSRHTRRRWIRECLEHRAAARAGAAVSLIVEVDGRLGGQVAISAVDHRARSGELGAWVDAKLAHAGVGGLASAMIVDHVMGYLGLDRVTAPVSTENAAARISVQRGGMRREAVMADSFDAGGRRRDHELWAVTREDIPPGGFTELWLANFTDTDSSTTTPVGRQPTTEHLFRHLPSSIIEIVRFHVGDRYCRWLERSHDVPPDPKPRGGVPVRLRVQPQSSGQQDRRAVTFAVIEDGEQVTVCGLSAYDPTTEASTLWVDVPDAASTMAVETAVASMLAYSFDVLGFLRVAATTMADDRRLAALLERAGLVREGTLRGYIDLQGRRGEHDLWAMTRSAWDRIGTPS